MKWWQWGMIFLVCLTNSHNSHVREVKVKRMEWGLSCSFKIYVALLREEKCKKNCHWWTLFREYIFLGLWLFWATDIFIFIYSVPLNKNKWAEMYHELPCPPLDMKFAFENKYHVRIKNRQSRIQGSWLKLKAYPLLYVRHCRNDLPSLGLRYLICKMWTLIVGFYCWKLS